MTNTTKKRLAALGMTTILGVGALAGASLAESRLAFPDVQSSAWYYNAVDTVTNDLKLMSGYDTGLFGPGDSLTREQFVQILYKMSGVKSEGYGAAGSKFTDVDTTAWYAPALAWAEENNVTSGTSDTTFGTGQAVTREQMAVLMKNYCKQNDLDPVGDSIVESFADADTASNWAKTGVEWSRKAGLFVGDENHNFNPGKDLSRAEAAQVIAKFYSNAHDYDLTATEEAGCTTEGSETYTCKICAQTKTESVPALGHSWNKGKVTKKATCTESGEKTYTCVRDGATKTETIQATGHDWSDVTITKAATCTETGSKVVACTNDGCDETKTESVPARGHSWNKGKVTKEATCTEDGEKTYTCVRDGATKTEMIQATGHEWGDVTITKAATCTEAGSKVVACTNDGCDETKTETIAALGHSWSKGKVTKEATCTEAGERTYTCVRDGATKTETIQATGHKYQVTDSKVATCTENGYTTYTCNACGDSYSDTIEATGHTPSETFTKLTLLDGSDVPVVGGNEIKNDGYHTNPGTGLTEEVINGYLEAANNQGDFGLIHMYTAEHMAQVWEKTESLIVGRDEDGKLYAEDTTREDSYGPLAGNGLYYTECISGFVNSYDTCAGYGEAHYKIYYADVSDMIPVNAKYVWNDGHFQTDLWKEIATIECDGKHEGNRSGGWSHRSKQPIYITYVAHHSCTTCGAVTD